MGNMVFFPTNNVGKYDRYKNSFEKAGFIYKRYLIENNNEVKVDVVEDGKSLKENAEKRQKSIMMNIRDI